MPERLGLALVCEPAPSGRVREDLVSRLIAAAGDLLGEPARIVRLDFGTGAFRGRPWAARRTALAEPLTPQTALKIRGARHPRLGSTSLSITERGPRAVYSFSVPMPRLAAMPIAVLDALVGRCWQAAAAFGAGVALCGPELDVAPDDDPHATAMSCWERASLAVWVVLPAEWLPARLEPFERVTPLDAHWLLRRSDAALWLEQR